jgi:nitrite reductase/ring-hydroxylating ferredoxin subunit
MSIENNIFKVELINLDVIGRKLVTFFLVRIFKNQKSSNDKLLGNCSHERAFYLYLETIRGKKFVGCPCKSWEDYQTGKCYCNFDTEGAELMGEFCNSS